MKNRILNNKLRFSAVFFSFLSLTLLFVMSCDMDPVSIPDSDLILNEAVANEVLKKGGGQIEICHFPPGNPDNPQKMTVGGKAAENHINNHEGDGIVGVDYDENCQPLAVACPCYSADDLAEYSWGLLIDWEGAPEEWQTQLSDGLGTNAAVFYTGTYGFSGCYFQNRGVEDGIDINIRDISLDEANACRELLFEFDPG